MVANLYRTLLAGVVALSFIVPPVLANDDGDEGARLSRLPPKLFGKVIDHIPPYQTAGTIKRLRAVNRGLRSQVYRYVQEDLLPRLSEGIRDGNIALIENILNRVPRVPHMWNAYVKARGGVIIPNLPDKGCLLLSGLDNHPNLVNDRTLLNFFYEAIAGECKDQRLVDLKDKRMSMSVYDRIIFEHLLSRHDVYYPRGHSLPVEALYDMCNGLIEAYASRYWVFKIGERVPDTAEYVVMTQKDFTNPENAERLNKIFNFRPNLTALIDLHDCFAFHKCGGEANNNINIKKVALVNTDWSMKEVPNSFLSNWRWRRLKEVDMRACFMLEKIGDDFSPGFTQKFDTRGWVNVSEIGSFFLGLKHITAFDQRGLISCQKIERNFLRDSPVLSSILFADTRLSELVPRLQSAPDVSPRYRDMEMIGLVPDDQAAFNHCLQFLDHMIKEKQQRAS